MGWEAQREEGYKSCALLSQWPPGANKCTQACSQGRGWEWETKPACFHFAVCFLFRSTAQFWFGPLRRGVWQVRISGATHLCLPQGCGLNFPSPCRSKEVQPLLACQPHSFHFSPFLSLSFIFTFSSFSFCMSLFPSPSFLLPSSHLALEFVLSLFCLCCASLIQ